MTPKTKFLDASLEKGAYVAGGLLGVFFMLRAFITPNRRKSQTFEIERTKMAVLRKIAGNRGGIASMDLPKQREGSVFNFV